MSGGPIKTVLSFQYLAQQDSFGTTRFESLTEPLNRVICEKQGNSTYDRDSTYIYKSLIKIFLSTVMSKEIYRNQVSYF